MEKENTPSPERYEKPKDAINKLIIAGLLLLLVGVGVYVYSMQRSEIAELNDKISFLEKTQLPQATYESYDECNANNGPPLVTYNGQFNACLGGNIDESGELPQYQAFLQYSAQNLPRINDKETTENANKVTADGDYSEDLINFLRSDYTGCEPRGEYEIVKEVEDRFALMKYGCDTDGQVQSDNPPTIIAMKLADGWVLLSPTNNMDGETPSCLLVDMFKISKELSAQCYENTGYNNGSLKDVVYP